MSDILETILEQKRVEIGALAKRHKLHDLERIALAQPAPRGFWRAMNEAANKRGAAVIAEIKKASPSKGLIREDFDPGWLARDYERGGAACLSVLTDEKFFQGHNDYLVEARQHSKLPAIRKDFLIHELQIAESRALGADCILLIAAALEPTQLAELAIQAQELAMDVLIEVHDRAELEAVIKLALPPPILLGINNRNLRTFETRLETTLELMPLIPSAYEVVTESGIATHDDVQRMADAGVKRFLIGESLMRKPSPGDALARLLKG